MAGPQEMNARMERGDGGVRHGHVSDIAMQLQADGARVIFNLDYGGMIRG